MDEKVAQELKLAFSLDLYETVKAARRNRDEHVFRHTMAEEGGQMVFVGMFPKKDLLEMPNMTEEFAARLRTFNLLGVVTDGKSGLDMFYLGGMNKPYTTLNNGRELAGTLADEPVFAFLEMYFRIKGMMFDFRVMTYDEFLKAVESEVFKSTSFSRMSEAQELLAAMEN
ncbi:hypothetical protein BerOc1_00422 [Pseudodesulfovibrio hydrargyri]|uniref:Uncharacterized protein n=1 Tax=Pseudodesulfovibrio hydrargyri TaxID=2125990 RepID=A0A1J5N1F2_9BACT|nr:hypothetical protein [Pseudodesulfovibrio hydrargyri]OIQ51956.1 hypothetical protein BerOc1_00422 [Pseudodesulfovibrio hydrargyri]